MFAFTNKGNLFFYVITLSSLLSCLISILSLTIVLLLFIFLLYEKLYLVFKLFINMINKLKKHNMVYKPKKKNTLILAENQKSFISLIVNLSLIFFFYFFLYLFLPLSSISNILFKYFVKTLLLILTCLFLKRAITISNICKSHLSYLKSYILIQILCFISMYFLFEILCIQAFDLIFDLLSLFLYIRITIWSFLT